ncbi:MAG: hypothetical protein KC501_38615 [Myxococcales bacterium]|nr:hypothetical protein [Myxococcales bacterium]
MLAATVALSFVMAPLSAVQAAAQDSEIERLYVEGQDKYAAGDFSGAADAWTQLLDRLPEAQANRATRENVLLNVLQAHLDGYSRTRNDDGSKNIQHLRDAKGVLDDYFSGFKGAYGDNAAVSAAVQEKADELDRALEAAEKEAAAAAQPDPGPTDPDPGPTQPGKTGPDIIVLEAENDGGGLIVGGAVSAGLSLAGFGVLAAGSVIAVRAEDDFIAAQEAGDDVALASAEKSGNTGNALTITGAIVGPVLLITGGVLIGLGIKKRKDARAAREEQLRKTIGVVPTGGRGFGGLMIHGRF